MNRRLDPLQTYKNARAQFVTDDLKWRTKAQEAAWQAFEELLNSGSGTSRLEGITLPPEMARELRLAFEQVLRGRVAEFFELPEERSGKKTDPERLRLQYIAVAAFRLAKDKQIDTAGKSPSAYVSGLFGVTPRTLRRWSARWPRLRDDWFWIARNPQLLKGAVKWYRSGHIDPV